MNQSGDSRSYTLHFGGRRENGRSACHAILTPTNRSKEFMTRICQFLAMVTLSCAAVAQDHPGAGEFIDRAVSEFGLEADEVKALIADANFKQSIVDAISRPAEDKPWYQYRPIFLNKRRISEGIAFWQKNHDLIRRVSEQYGVDPQIIVAIIGVETLYGRITGSYRVLDALATLGFYYPDRKSVV